MMMTNLFGGACFYGEHKDIKLVSKHPYASAIQIISTTFFVFCSHAAGLYFESWEARKYPVFMHVFAFDVIWMWVMLFFAWLVSLAL